MANVKAERPVYFGGRIYKRGEVVEGMTAPRAKAEPAPENKAEAAPANKAQPATQTARKGGRPRKRG